MGGLSRYNVSKKEAGLEGGVLKNKLGITGQQKLDDTETILLSDAYTHFSTLLEQRRIVFNLALLFNIHKFFLNTLYSWAGKVRTIDISKNGMLFAPARYINNTLKQFENTLKKYLPNEKDTKRKVAKKLAVIHNEFNAIHPFREGNGRTIRLFLDLLAAHLGYDPINWGKTKRGRYIKACAEGMARRHKTMEQFIYRGLAKKTKS